MARVSKMARICCALLRFRDQVIGAGRAVGARPAVPNAKERKTLEMSEVSEETIIDLSLRPETLEEAIDMLCDMKLDLESAEAEASAATSELRKLRSELNNLAEEVRSLRSAIT